MILNSNPIIVISGILFFIVVSFFAVLGVISAVDDIDESVFSIKTAVGDNVDVFIQDQTTEVIDYYFTRVINTTSLTAIAIIDEQNVSVSDTAGAGIGRAINIYDDDSFFQGMITGVGVDNISFNAPLDKAFSLNSIVEFAEWNMAVDGGTSSKEYSVCSVRNKQWDIVRSLFSITDNAAMDTSLFGGIPALTNGVLLRLSDGYQKNIFVIRDNSGFAERNYDNTYSSKAPAGFYGFISRRTFGGQDKNGVVLRLNGATDDCLKIIINDDLTDLIKFAAIAQGHVVEK